MKSVLSACTPVLAVLAALLAASPVNAAPSEADSLASGLKVRPQSVGVPTRTLAVGHVYQRTLLLERMRFRRDGDVGGGKGEVKFDWSVVPPATSPLFLQSGTSSKYKVAHSKKSKKCDEDGCVSNSDGDCNWTVPNVVAFTDWAIEDGFCNPLRVSFDFREYDKNSDQSIGKYFTNAGNDLTGPAGGSGSTTRCDAFDLTGTKKGTPAKMTLRWNMDQKQFGALAGSLSCSGDTNSCGEIENYTYQHISGPELRSDAVLKTVDLDFTGFSGNRKIYFLYDIDGLPGTGDPTFPFCGADYRVFVDLQYSGSGAPTVTKRIEAWDAGTSQWGLTGDGPSSFAIHGKEIELVVLRSKIGNPVSQVISWAAFEQNAILAGLMPCLPCIERMPIQLDADTQCASLRSVDDVELSAGLQHGKLRIGFSEPMAPIAPGDLAVSPALPLGTSLATAQVDDARGLEVTASPAWPPGVRQITLSGLTDQAGNGLENPQTPGVCGAAIPLTFCIDDSALRITDAAGTPMGSSTMGTPIYVKGEGFAPSTSYSVYLTQQDGLGVPGALLADYSSDGPNVVLTNALGQIPLTSLGLPVAPDEYGVIIDVNANGVADSTDRYMSVCGVGLEVGPMCDDEPGPLMAYWSFDHVSRLVLGDRSAGRNGAIHGPAGWIPGRLHGAMHFDGSSNYAEVAADDQLLPEDADFSVSVWVRTTVGSGTIFSHAAPAGVGYTLSLQGGKPRFDLTDPTGTTSYLAAASPTFADGQWHLLSVSVQRDGNVTIYRDVANVGGGSAVPRNGVIHHGSPIDIGAAAGPTSFYAGDLDELRLADEAFSQDDVATFYRRDLFGGCDDAVVAVPPSVATLGVSLSSPVVTPNPARANATIRYDLPAAGQVRLALYDVAGRRIRSLREGFESAGVHDAAWSGADLAAGMYFLRLQWEGMTATRSVIVAH